MRTQNRVQNGTKVRKKPEVERIDEELELKPYTARKKKTFEKPKVNLPDYPSFEK